MVTPRLLRLCRIVLGTRASGCHNLRQAGPLILVSNHVGSFGPVSIVTTLPITVHPWVAHDVTEIGAAARRIRTEFIEGELHWKPPISRWASRVVARICVTLMRDLDVVPVYDRSRRIKSTVDRSLRLLEQGRCILVFPEDAAVRANEVMCELRTGFINLARAYFEKTKRAVSFLPIAVHPRVRRIRVGPPIQFNGSIPFRAEKLRLKRELSRTITGLYYDIEREATGGVPPHAGTA